MRKSVRVLVLLAALLLALSVGSGALAGPHGPIFPSYMSVTAPGGVWDVTTLRSPFGPITPFRGGPFGPVTPTFW